MLCDTHTHTHTLTHTAQDVHFKWTHKLAKFSHTHKHTHTHTDTLIEYIKTKKMLI